LLDASGLNNSTFHFLGCKQQVFSNLNNSQNRKEQENPHFIYGRSEDAEEQVCTCEGSGGAWGQSHLEGICMKWE